MAEESKSNMSSEEEDAYVKRMMAEAMSARLAREAEEDAKAIALPTDLYARPIFTEEVRAEAMKDLKTVVAAQSMELYNVCRTSDIDSLDLLTARLKGYVQYMYRTEGRAVRILELNRRYGMIARRLFGMSLLDVMNLTTSEGDIGAVNYRSVYIYCDLVRLNMDVWELKTLAEKDEFKRNVYEKAFDSLKK